MDLALELIESSDTYTQLALNGRMDIAGAGAVEPKFIGYTVARKKHSLVNMSGVEFLGSMGIRVFVSAAKALARDQKQLILFAAQPSVEKTLALSGFSSVISVVPTLDEAKARIAA